ncbi:MAG: hypothetical protein WBA77_05995 [Microcoleaceae cyanobacterium]
MTQTSNPTKPLVDLVIVIDTSPSMRDEAQGLSEATKIAMRAAARACPSDLRVTWLGIEGRWNGTNFNRTARNYLVQVCKVPGNQLRGRRRGELPSAGAQEDGARAIEDLASHFDWRSGAGRAIFFLGDEALEGGGDQTELADIEAANQAIEKAKAAGVKIHTYFGTSKSKHRDGISSEYQRLATETGGQAFGDQDSVKGYVQLLETVICSSRPTAVTTSGISSSASALEPGVAYIQDSVAGKNSQLYRLNLTTGKASLIGATVQEVADLAFVNRQLYGVAIKPGSQTSQLLSIDPASGQTTVVGNTGFAITGLAYDPIRQVLYGTTAKQLISINPVTGSGRPVMSVANQKYNCGEVAIDAQGNAYITLINAERHKYLASCDLTKGTINIIGDIGFPNISSMKFYDNTLYGVTGNFFNLGKNGELITINTNTAKGTLITMTDPAKRWAGFEIYNPLPQKTSTQTPISTAMPASSKPSSAAVNATDPLEKTPVTPLSTPSSKPSSAAVNATDPLEKTPVTPVTTPSSKPGSLNKPAADTPQRSGQPVSVNWQNLSFDSFERNPQQDIVCVAPVRTIVRREEEITIIRRVRKVEEIDASPACPSNTTQL